MLYGYGIKFMFLVYLQMDWVISAHLYAPKAYLWHILYVSSNLLSFYSGFIG